MTVNETLQASESTAEFKKSFARPDTVVYSNGLLAAQEGYSHEILIESKQAELLNVPQQNAHLVTGGVER